MTVRGPLSDVAEFDPEFADIYFHEFHDMLQMLEVSRREQSAALAPESEE
jgi:hypothetical protein